MFRMFTIISKSQMKLQRLSTKLLLGVLFLSFSFIIFSCKEKEENSYVFLWSDTFGSGSAYAVGTTDDFFVASCGTVSGKPFFVKLNDYHRPTFTYSSDRQGRFTDFVSDDGYFVAAGSSEDALLLSIINDQGKMVWDTLIVASFDIDLASICKLGPNSFLAIGSGCVDSLSDNSGIFFVNFDNGGNVRSKNEVMESYPIYAEDATVDAQGNIYIASTRLFNETKVSAMASKFSSELNKEWEVALYNNPLYSSASLGVEYEPLSGSVYVTGKTETSLGENIVNNSFVVSLKSSNGQQLWKKYCEKSNKGVDVTFDGEGKLYMQNSNCFVVSVLDGSEGESLGLIRMFDACDSYDTNEFGTTIDMCQDGTLIIGGSKGSSYFLALKSTDVIDLY